MTDFTKEINKICQSELQKNDDDFQNDYNEFSRAIKTPEKDIPLYEWMLLSLFAGNGLKSAVRAVHDAYKFGYAIGKEYAENHKEEPSKTVIEIL